MRYTKALLLFLSLCLLSVDSAFGVTIYFAGGEDVDFTAIGSTSVLGSGVRSAFSRASIVSTSNSTADPIPGRWQTPAFTAVSTLWIHAQIESNLASGTSGIQALRVLSPDGVARIMLRQTGTAGQLKASTHNAAGTFVDLATATGNWSTLTPTAVDLKIVYGCTAGDQVQLWLNAAQVINYTGASICTDAATTLNQVELGNMNNNTGGAGNTCTSGSAGSCWTEIIVSDSDTRSMGLWTLQPVAAGNTQSWTPNTVGNINPNTINDTNFVSTTTNNALSQWTTPTAAPTGIWSVLAVVQSARVRVAGTGPQHFEWLCRSGGTDHVTGSVAPGLSFGNWGPQIWVNNCSTGSAWAISDIATGFNLGIESLP